MKYSCFSVQWLFLIFWFSKCSLGTFQYEFCAVQFVAFQVKGP